MSMIHIQTDPSPRFLRQFAAAALVFFALAAVPLWLRGHTLAAACLAAAGAAIAAAGLIAPRSVRWVYVALALAALPVGAVVSTLVLLAVYLLVFTPIGCIMRLLGRDAMTRRLDRSAASYWLPRPDVKRDYFRQF